jgi:hypothetical protein
MKVDVQNRPVMAGSHSAVKRSKQIRYFWTRKRKWCKSQRNPYCSNVFEQQDQDSILILLLESCLQNCMTYTIAECTVNNS